MKELPHPQDFIAWRERMDEILENHESMMKFGCSMGWWDSLDEKGPIKSIKLKLSDGPSMAHILHKGGLFKSISDAKRNGWDKPPEAGRIRIGKRVIDIS